MASLRRINQDDLRNHNLSVVIDTLLRASGPMSRADLAKETGLTKATMSLLVSLLIDAGVVKEGEPQNSASYGRPSTPLMLGRRQGVRRRHAGQHRRLWMHGFGHQPRHYSGTNGWMPT